MRRVGHFEGALEGAFNLRLDLNIKSYSLSTIKTISMTCELGHDGPISRNHSLFLVSGVSVLGVVRSTVRGSSKDRVNYRGSRSDFSTFLSTRFIPFLYVYPVRSFPQPAPVAPCQEIYMSDYFFLHFLSHSLPVCLSHHRGFEGEMNHSFWLCNLRFPMSLSHRATSTRHASGATQDIHT